MTLTKSDVVKPLDTNHDEYETHNIVIVDGNKARQEFANKVADELEPLDDEKTGDYLWRMQQLQKTLRGNGK